MPAPASLAAIGVQRPGARQPGQQGTRAQDRFADLRALRLRQMPRVVPGQVWADGDPRKAGRSLRIVQVRRDWKAVVETVTPPTGAAERGAADRFGVIAVRRFRPGSRGFTLVSDAPKPKRKRQRAAAGRVPTHAAQIAATAQAIAGDRPVREQETRAAAALCGLLGGEGARTFLAAHREPVRGVPSAVGWYRAEGIGGLMGMAIQYGRETGMLRK